MGSQGIPAGVGGWHEVVSGGGGGSEGRSVPWMGRGGGRQQPVFCLLKDWGWDSGTGFRGAGEGEVRICS